MGEGFDRLFGDDCVVGWQRFALLKQAQVIEAAEKIADAFDFVICRAKIFLAKSFRSDLASLLFIRKVGERNQVKEFVDKLDDRTVFGWLMLDGVRDPIGRDQDERNARSLIERNSRCIV